MIEKALLSGVYIRAPDFWKLPVRQLGRYPFKAALLVYLDGQLTSKVKLVSPTSPQNKSHKARDSAALLSPQTQVKAEKSCQSRPLPGSLQLRILATNLFSSLELGF